MTTPNVSLEVGSEVDVIAEDDAHVEVDGACSRPKRAASTQHAALGKFVLEKISVTP